MTPKELESNGFEFSDYELGWIHNHYPKYSFTIDVHGKATFVKENSNYHGISLKPMKEIRELLNFIQFLE